MTYQNNNHNCRSAAALSLLKHRAILLSIRETEVAILMCKELSTKQIAAVLKISPHTVDSHKKSLRIKTGSFTEIGVVIYAVKNNIFLFVCVITMC
ncbi:MAG: hypothetical protein KGM16_01220 [Bacteroidota bacterium]|nr:hypothetical protein [Bacteroidota bacterium]